MHGERDGTGAGDRPGGQRPPGPLSGPDDRAILDHLAAVDAYARGMTSDMRDRDEFRAVARLALVEAARGLDRGRCPAGLDFRVCAFHRARDAIRTHVRRDRRWARVQPAPDAWEIVDPRPGPAEAVAAGDPGPARGLLAGLDPRAADLLRLKFGLDGGPPRSAAEVARLTGVGERTVQRAVRHAEEELRRREAGVRPDPPRLRGVHRKGRYGRWAAHVKVDGHDRHLGMFATAEDAALARDRAVRELGLPARLLNFPGVEDAG